MKRRNLLLSLVALLLLVGTTVHTAPSRAAGSNVVVWTTGADDDALVFKVAADLWAKKTGNTVTVQAVSWDDAFAKFLAAATSGQGPDVITGGLSFGIELGSKGGMVDLAKKFPDDVKKIKEAANKGVLASIQSLDGAMYGVPYDVTVELMYYRQDALEKAGVKAVPKTWEEMAAAAKAIRAANGGKGGFTLDWGNAGWLGFANYLWQAGGDFYSPDCKTAIINNDKGLVALKYFASLYTDMGAPSGTIDLPNGLVTGEYPLGVSGNWLVASIDSSKPEIKGKWNVALMPAGPSGKSTAFIGGRIIGIMSYSKAVDPAMDLIRFIYTDDAAKASIKVAADKSAIFLPAQTAAQEFFSVATDKLPGIKAQLADAKGPPNCPGFEIANKEVDRLIQTVVFKGADPQEALDAMADELQKGLKK